MDNQEMKDFSSALSPNNFSTDNLPLATKRQIQNEACEVVRAVARKNMIENGMAMIQTTAMRNVADLSMLQEQYATQCPSSEARLAYLVNEYTYRSNRRLSGGGN